MVGNLIFKTILVLPLLLAPSMTAPGTTPQQDTIDEMIRVMFVKLTITNHELGRIPPSDCREYMKLFYLQNKW